jgi:hypothetical protein
MSMHLYCVWQILVFNAINTIVTDMECNIRIDILPLGRGTDQWKWYCHNDPWSVSISWYCPPYISNYYINIISWHDCYLSLWYVCTEEQRRKLLIYIAIFGRFHLSSMTTKQCLCIVVFRSQLWFISYVCKMYFIQVEAKYYQGYIY